jgi:L-ascorbate metabolism protein UlaG (beta-lactamase superfamily)
MGAALLDLGSWVYRTAPSFYKRVRQDFQRDIRPAPHRPDPAAWPNTGFHAAWLGHSTVLLKIDGLTILTDPVFSKRAGIGLGPVTLGLKRLVDPALAIAELPEIDVVLLSHAHMDHFDIPSLHRLEGRGVTVVTASRTSDLLRAGRYSAIRELRWDERTRIGPLEIHAFPVRHWGARMRRDTYRGYNGYTLDCGRYRILFGGDTAMTDGFRQLRTSRPFDLAIMPVGAYNPWINAHCTPEQAWRMAQDAGAEFFLPVHHQTFMLSREPYFEPIERVYNAAGNHSDRVALSRIGQQFQIN